MTDAIDMDALLRSALTPVEPSEALSDRLERGLSELTDAAVGELADWELSAMRDPRNWGRIARPVAAVTIGSTAGAALVVLRVRAGRKRRRAASANTLDYAEQTFKALADEARRLLAR